MGVLTQAHCDDSELTEAELQSYRSKLYHSLKSDYIVEIRRRRSSGQYALNEQGEQTLYAQAWEATISQNAVCREISALSAQRREQRRLEAQVLECVRMAIPINGFPPAALPTFASSSQSSTDFRATARSAPGMN